MGLCFFYWNNGSALVQWRYYTLKGELEPQKVCFDKFLTGFINTGGMFLSLPAFFMVSSLEGYYIRSPTKPSVSNVFYKIAWDLGLWTSVLLTT